MFGIKNNGYDYNYISHIDNPPNYNQFSNYQNNDNKNLNNFILEDEDDDINKEYNDFYYHLNKNSGYWYIVKKLAIPSWYVENNNIYLADLFYPFFEQFKKSIWDILSIDFYDSSLDKTYTNIPTNEAHYLLENYKFTADNPPTITIYFKNADIPIVFHPNNLYF